MLLNGPLRLALQNLREDVRSRPLRTALTMVGLERWAFCQPEQQALSQIDARIAAALDSSFQSSSNVDPVGPTSPIADNTGHEKESHGATDTCRRLHGHPARWKCSCLEPKVGGLTDGLAVPRRLSRRTL